jgi:PKD repeat protein
VGGSINSTTINWGDGGVSNGASASHSYSTAGTYTVTATATDNYGKSSSASQSVTVQAPVAVAPTASMKITMNGPTATVTSTSIAGSGTITSTVINWGDGTSTNAASASHTYAKGGFDTITLTVTNSAGKTASTSQQVTAAGVVIWLPQPGATAAQPVHIAATAYDSKTIASMAVYLDGNQIWLGYVNDFDLWQSMRSGTHTIVVNAWESGTGVLYQATVKFKGQ